MYFADGSVRDIAKVPGSLIYGEAVLEGSIIPDHVRFVTPIEGVLDMVCGNLTRRPVLALLAAGILVQPGIAQPLASLVRRFVAI